MHAYRQSRKLHFPHFITLNITRVSIYSISARRFIPRTFKFQQTSFSDQILNLCFLFRKFV